MKDPLTVDHEARKNATLQWNTNPCGAVPGFEGNSLAYFLRVEHNRYQIQPWMHDYFQFEKFAGKRVLEIGVGLGTDLVQFGKAGAFCHGIDITDKHLLSTARNFAVRGLNVELKKCDATEISYPDNTFDAVYSFGVIHHIPNAERVFAEIFRVLKPGGTLYVGLYYKYSAFHIISKLLLQGIIERDLFRLGYKGLLATIEKGADGKNIKPYVKLYSKSNLRKLLVRFFIINTSIHQLEPEILKRLPFVKILRLEKLFGWFLSCTAIKTKS